MIVSGSHDGEIRLWNPADPADPGRILGRHDNQVRAVAVTADGIIITGGIGGSIRFWDRLRSGRWSTELGRHGSVMDIAILSGRYVISAGLNGTVRLWDAKHPAKGCTEMIPDSAVRSVTATPDGHVLFGCADGTLGLWDPAVTGTRGLRLGTYPGSVGALAATTGSRVFAANDHMITMLTLTVS
jgi:WD40 repeat protein